MTNEKQDDILVYIDKVIHSMTMKDKQEFDDTLDEGKSIPVSRKELALVVTNLITNINSQMNSLEGEVIDNFNVMIQSMVDTEIITEDTVKQMQENLYKNTKQEENE